MKDDAETLLDRMNRLQELTELAHYAAPEDRALIGHTIEPVGPALLAVAQAQDTAERHVREQADAALVDWRSELAELRIMMEDIPR
jgi:hypothetical protein